MYTPVNYRFLTGNFTVEFDMQSDDNSSLLIRNYQNIFRSQLKKLPLCTTLRKLIAESLSQYCDTMLVQKYGQPVVAIKEKLTN